MVFVFTFSSQKFSLAMLWDIHELIICFMIPHRAAKIQVDTSILIGL
jgi:hypothetical protein